MRRSTSGRTTASRAAAPIAWHRSGSFEQSHDAVGKLIGVARRDQEARFGLRHRFVDRADVRRHDGPSDAHRFQDRNRVRFVVRREGEHIHRREQPRHVVARAEE